MSEHTPHSPSYRVTRQEQSTQLSEHGRPQKVWTVHLEHGDGTKTSVELPDELYTPENVHAMASAQANDVAAVANLPESAQGN